MSPHENPSFRAVAQLDCVVGDISGNARRILDAVARAKAAGADVLLTPELALCGYPPEDLLLRPAFLDACAEELDALAAQVGGLGLAPGVNMSDTLAFYEATHGTAPTIAGKDKANPGSVILCGALMLEHLGQHDAANRIREAVGKAITGKSVTEDLAAQVTGSRVVGCKEFGDIIGAYL